MYLFFLLHDRSLWFANFLFKKYQVQATWIQTDLFWCCGTSFFYAYSSPYALRLLCFALFPRLSPWQPWQLGTPAKVLPLFYPLGRLERLKTVLMGTNTPHTFIPGLVWQKQARRFSQFQLKVGELGFPIHFVCVSAALYHRGHAAAIFPLRWIRSIYDTPNPPYLPTFLTETPESCAKGERGGIATRTTFLLTAPLFFTFLTSNFPTLFVRLNFILWFGSVSV